MSKIYFLILLIFLTGCDGVMNSSNQAFEAPNARVGGIAEYLSGLISTIHDTSKYSIKSEILSRLGLPVPKEETINLHTLIHFYSHISNIVSQSMKTKVINQNFWNNTQFNSLLSERSNQKRFYEVNNGILFKNFYIAQPSVLGNLHVANYYSYLNEKKLEAKSVLYKNGTLGSATKPLFVFIVRLAWEKGIAASHWRSKRV